MARPFLILDGYNVLHAAGLGGFRGAPGQLQQGREVLLHHIAEHLTELECRRTHVVFDAMNAPRGLPRSQHIRGITIQFADPGGDADTVIEELIRAHTAPRQVRVVSSDHRIQRAAKRRQCRFIDSEAWLARLEKRAHRESASARKPLTADEAVKFGGKLAPEEVAQWLNEFGPQDVARDRKTTPTKDWTDGIERLR